MDGGGHRFDGSERRREDTSGEDGEGTRERSAFTMEQRGELMSPGDVAELFGVSAKTVSRWAADGKIGYVVLPSGHRRYYTKDVKWWWEQRQDKVNGR